MSYTVLARRYRSRDFDELVGQEPIARTLRNAVASGRAAHAYLFCGTRGVGKTSMARILANALNVTDDLTQADEITEAIFRGDDLDVVEIDGASNRGINEAKDLIAGAGLSPSRCPYKIYIIDEVHMLTTPAFNALLKTMEEPPAHVKFILCTTEVHKVPATIQSRCQRFDFRPLSTAQISGQLNKILRQEGVEADEHVVTHIARLGRGSMRDALSLLDRLLAAGEKLTGELLEQMLGLPDQTLISNLIESIAAGDAAATLSAGARLLSAGPSIEQALELLIEHLRQLMLLAACGDDTELVDLSGAARQAAVKQAHQFDPAGLVHMIALCDAAARNVRGSTAASAIFDATIVRLSMSEHLADIGALLGEGGPRAVKQHPEPRKKKEPLTIPVAEREPSSPRPTPTPAPTAVVESKPVHTPPEDESDGARLWRKVCQVAAGTPSNAAKVQHLAFEAFDGQTLRLAVNTSDTGLARWLAGQSDAVASIVQQAVGRNIRVELSTSAAIGLAPAASLAGKIAEVQQLPVVRKAMEIFNADVVDVQDAPRPSPGTPDKPGSQDHV
ncbi:MAG: DNA polymerase III subunit gamma/tau [Phycisphaerales bacterium]